jgi:hypothetical protein
MPGPNRLIFNTPMHFMSMRQKAVRKSVLSDDAKLQALSQDDLSKQKTILEIESLSDAYDAAKKASNKNFIELLTKWVGYLTGLILLITGVTGPLNKYLHDRFSEQRISLSKDIEKVLDSGQDSAIKRSSIIQLSLEQPRVTAPILLKSFNDGLITSNLMQDIYKNMYQLSTVDLYYETILDKIATLTEPSNKKILEKTLLTYSIQEFNAHLDNPALTEKQTAYLYLIKDLDLQDEKPFNECIDQLRQKCKPEDPLLAVIANIKSDNHEKAVSHIVLDIALAN